MTESSVADEMVWSSDESLYLAHVFEDTTLVYCKPSGDTHFLSFLPADILKKIGQTPMSARALHLHFLSEYDFTEVDLPESILNDAIAQLDEIGLAWSKPTNKSKRA